MLFGPAAAGAYPVRLEADYPAGLSRLSTLFRLVLAVPVLILLYLVGSAAQTGLVFGHWIAVLVRGRPVGWLFEAIVAVQRLTLRAAAYFVLLDDRYPPFDGDWPVRYEVDRPGRLSRWQLVFWKTALVIPHLVVLTFVLIGVVFAVTIAWFAILFSGRYPRGLHTFVSGWLRWAARANAYWLSLTDEFPSFSLSAEAGAADRSSYVVSAVIGWLIVAAWGVGIGVLIAWPTDTEEVRVSYEGLLAGEPSDEAEVSGVRVSVMGAGEFPREENAAFRAKQGSRLVVFRLTLENGSDSGVDVEGDDLSLKDSDGRGHDAMFVTVDGRLSPRKIRVGRAGDVWVMFEVDEDSGPVELTYDPSFGFKRRVKFVLE